MSIYQNIQQYIKVIKKGKKRKKGNGTIQIAYLKGVGYCEHHHYHYPYVVGTKNNFLKRNLNEA